MNMVDILVKYAISIRRFPNCIKKAPKLYQLKNFLIEIAENFINSLGMLFAYYLLFKSLNNSRSHLEVL